MKTKNLIILSILASLMVFSAIPFQTANAHHEQVALFVHGHTGGGDGSSSGFDYLYNHIDDEFHPVYALLNGKESTSSSTLETGKVYKYAEGGYISSGSVAYDNHKDYYHSASQHDDGSYLDLEHETNGADLRHIAYHLAWYIYYGWSINQESIVTFGHSIGGLIIRHMLIQVDLDNPYFPDDLYVDNVVTGGSPYEGAIGWDVCFDKWSCQTNWESDREDVIRYPSSSVPRGSAQAVWTMIGSYDDDIVSDESAIAYKHDFAFVYDYWYDHSELRCDGEKVSSSTTRDAYVSFYDSNTLIGADPSYDRVCDLIKHHLQFDYVKQDTSQIWDNY